MLHLPRWGIIAMLTVLFAFEASGMLWYHFH